MEHIGSEHLVYAFSPDNKPVATVDPDEIFLVDCPDCYSGQIRSKRDLRPAIDTSILSATCDLCVSQMAALPIRS